MISELSVEWRTRAACVNATSPLDHPDDMGCGVGLGVAVAYGQCASDLDAYLADRAPRDVAPNRAEIAAHRGLWLAWLYDRSTARLVGHREMTDGIGVGSAFRRWQPVTIDERGCWPAPWPKVGG